MPLGDPGGGEFEYTDEGLPLSVFAVTVPVSDTDRSVRFYVDVLGFEVLGRDGSCAYMRRGGCRLVLRRSDAAGVDTGVYFAVDSPYNTRRRLIDEGVRFASDPARGPFGTYVSIEDPDGNVLRMVDPGAEFRLGTIP